MRRYGRNDDYADKVTIAKKMAKIMVNQMHRFYEEVEELVAMGLLSMKAEDLRDLYDDWKD